MGGPPPVGRVKLVRAVDGATGRAATRRPFVVTARAVVGLEGAARRGPVQPRRGRAPTVKAGPPEPRATKSVGGKVR